MADEDMSWLEVSGKVCVVTGAAGGIGKAIADAFTGAGAKVAYLDLDGTACVANAQASGGTAHGYGCDVGDQGAISNVAARIMVDLGEVDILVNNAGILRAGALTDVAINEWELMLRINVTGYLLCAQEFGRGMIARGAGAIVHVASIAATQPQAFSGAYSPGKAAVAMLSRQLAFEWGPLGVRSNCVSPGMIRTPLTEAFYQVPDVLARREAVVPLQRVGQPNDIANAVLFLASPRAGYISGQDIVVDGGFSQSLMSFVPRPGY